MSAPSIQQISAQPLQLSYQAMVMEAWETAKPQIVSILIGTIVWSFVFGFAYVLSMILIGLVLVPALMAGPLIVGGKIANGEEVSIGTYFAGFKRLVPLLILAVVVGVGMFAVAIVGGILSFLGTFTPFIIAMLLLNPVISIAAWLIIDREMAAIDALKDAVEVCKAHAADLIAFGAVSGGIMMIGSSVLFGLGGIVAMPVVIVFNGIFLRRLLGVQGGLTALS